MPGTWGRVALIVIASVLALAAPAAAQEEAGTRDAEARALFEAGVLAFDDERYEDALGHFRRAYELSGRPALLHNVGLAAERAGREADALDAFEAYLRAVPDAANRAEVEARIDELRADVADATPAASPAGPRPERDSGWILGRTWTWIALGAAAVLGGAAAVVWMSATSAYDELDQRCTASGGCTEEEIDAEGIDDRVTVTNVLLGASAVALAGAVVLFIVEGGGSDDGETAVVLGPTSIGVRGRF